MSERSASLFYKDGSSDKVYYIQIEAKGNGYVVNFQYGRRGSTLQSGTKTTTPVVLEQANKVFDKLVKEKTAKGYSPGEEGIPFQDTDKAGEVSGMIPQLLNPIDRDRLEELLANDDWFAQEKMDGRHVMVRRELNTTPGIGSQVTGSNRKGLIIPLPDAIVKGIKELIFTYGIVDGEAIGDIYHVFDLLELGGNDYRKTEAIKRVEQLRDMVIFKSPSNISFVRTAFGKQNKVQLFNDIKSENGEGIVFKKSDSFYIPGRPASGGNMLKFKFKSSATCQVLIQNGDKRSINVASIQDNGQLQSVGNVTIPVNYKVPAPGNFVEVEYLYFFPGGSLYQPVYKGPREDKAKADLVSSLKVKQGIGEEM